MIIEACMITKSDISGFMSMTLHRFGQMMQAAGAVLKRMKENQ